MPKASKSQKPEGAAQKPKPRSPMKSTVMTTGTGVDLGTSDPGDWVAREICYYKLGLSRTNGLRFEFLPGSGCVQIENNANGEFASFRDRVIAGTQQPDPFPVKANAPDMAVNVWCYIMIELDSSVNWRFLQKYPAIRIGTNSVPGGDVTKAYFSLRHIDIDGQPADLFDETTGCSYVDPTKTCRLMYFGVRARNKRGVPSLDHDVFNLYLEIDQGFGQLLPVILDPDIKNEGGTNPGLPPTITEKTKRQAAKR